MIPFLFALFSWAQASVVTVDFPDGNLREIQAVDRNGAVFVSTRELAGVLAGKRSWSPEKRKLVLNLGESDLVFTADDPYALAGTTSINLNAPPFLDQGDLFVPLQGLAPWLDSLRPERISFEPEKRTLYVKSAETLIRRASVEEKKNGTVYRLFLPDALKFDHTFFKPQLNLNFPGGKVSVSELVSKKRVGWIRETDAVQFGTSAQVSLILDPSAAEPEVAYRDNPPRVEVVVRPGSAGVEPAPAAETAVEEAPAPAPAAVLAPEDVRKKREKLSKIRTLIIDPGHGGEDPGAQNRKVSLNEKDVALAIGLKLREKVSRQMPELKVVLTRQDDRFIPLKDRSRIANNSGGGLFVSIHCNSVARAAAGSPTASGFVVYFLDVARDAESRALMALENAVIEYEKDKETEGVTDIDFIIKSSQLNLYRNESEDLAILLEQEMSKNLGGEVRRRKTGVNQAGFYVLRGPEMPSVLVETAFISNPNEAKLLGSGNFQDKIAEAIFQGLRRFKEKYEGML